MGVPGFGEWVIILGVMLLMFGGKRLPQLGGAIGESIRNFKKGLKDGETDEGQKTLDANATKTKTESEKN